jgi:hypothetical protein
MDTHSGIAILAKCLFQFLVVVHAVFLLADNVEEIVAVEKLAKLSVEGAGSSQHGCRYRPNFSIIDGHQAVASGLDIDVFAGWEELLIDEIPDIVRQSQEG